MEMISQIRFRFLAVLESGTYPSWPRYLGPKRCSREDLLDELGAILKREGLANDNEKIKKRIRSSANSLLRELIWRALQLDQSRSILAELRQSNERIQKPVQSFGPPGQLGESAFLHFREAVEQAPERARTKLFVLGIAPLFKDRRDLTRCRRPDIG